MRELHARAAAWHAANGDTSAAVHHALRAGLAALAGELVARDWNAYLQRGRIGTVRTWLDALPADLVERDPELCLARAWIRFDSGELEGVERWLAAAEAADDGRVPREGGSSIRGGRRHAAGDAGLRRRRPRRGRPPGRAGAAAGARRRLAVARGGARDARHGDVLDRRPRRAGGPVLEEAVGLERPGTNSLATLRSLGMLAVVALGLGDGDAAAGWVARADVLVAREALGEYHMAACATAVAGQLAAADGDPAAGEALLERAAVLARRGAARADLAYALCARVPVTATARGGEAAREVLREARRTVAACPDPGVLARDLDDAERRLRGRTPAHEGRRGEDLSEREMAVLRYLPTPLTFAEIAGELYVSKNTVRTHAQSIYRKLGADSRAGAVAAARRERLL